MSRNLSAHQSKRIRRAGAATLGRMVHQEAYWTSEALVLILDRVEVLLHETPDEAEEAARHALRILDRLVDPHPELRALALSVHGSTLRSQGFYDEALQRYSEALSLPGLDTKARSGVLRKQTAALILKGRLDEGLASIREALRLQPDDITSLAVRSWARLSTGDYEGTLEDCLVLLKRAHVRKNHRSFLAGIVNASAVLRMEAAPSDLELTQALGEAIAQCRRQIPKSGSGFYSLTLARSLLYHAEALLMARRGDYRGSIRLLRRALDNLFDKFPNDAFFAAVDLAFFYSMNEQEARAVKACEIVLELSEAVTLRIHRRGLAVARATVERGTLTQFQAVELRAMLQVV